jgi:hypothetical protein
VPVMSVREPSFWSKETEILLIENLSNGPNAIPLGRVTLSGYLLGMPSGLGQY